MLTEKKACDSRSSQQFFGEKKKETNKDQGQCS
jgi:hypothetical protein